MTYVGTDFSTTSLPSHTSLRSRTNQMLLTFDLPNVRLDIFEFFEIFSNSSLTFRQN